MSRRELHVYEGEARRADLEVEAEIRTIDQWRDEQEFPANDLAVCENWRGELFLAEITREGYIERLDEGDSADLLLRRIATLAELRG